MKKSKKSSLLTKRNKREVKKATEYLVSGGAYFWSGYLAYFVLSHQLHWAFWLAKLMADVVGWVVNYSLQRYWVFNNPKLAKHQTKVTIRYLIITAVDFALDYLIVLKLKEAGLTPYLGQFVSAGFFTVWNYIWYRFWVFPDKYPKARRRSA